MQDTTAPAGSAMQRFRARYGLVLEWVVIALMAILAIEVTLGVVFRAIGSSLVWYDEVASHLLPWLTFFASARAPVKRAPTGSREVVDQFGPRARRALSIVAQVVVILFFALLGWMGVAIMPALMGETLVSLPGIPMNFVQAALPVASALIVLAEGTHLVDMIATRTAATAPGGPALADGLH